MRRVLALVSAAAVGAVAWAWPARVPGVVETRVDPQADLRVEAPVLAARPRSAAGTAIDDDAWPHPTAFVPSAEIAAEWARDVRVECRWIGDGSLAPGLRLASLGEPYRSGDDGALVLPASAGRWLVTDDPSVWVAGVALAQGTWTAWCAPAPRVAGRVLLRGAGDEAVRVEVVARVPRDGLEGMESIGMVNPAETTSAGADGTFAVRVPRVRGAFVRIEASGYEPVSVVPSDGPLDVQLDPAPAVHGTVLDADARPVAGARLTVAYVARGLRPPEDATDARSGARTRGRWLVIHETVLPGTDGSFRRELQAAREALAVATAPGHEPRWASLGPVEGPVRADLRLARAESGRRRLTRGSVPIQESPVQVVAYAPFVVDGIPALAQVFRGGLDPDGSFAADAVATGLPIVLKLRLPGEPSALRKLWTPGPPGDVDVDALEDAR